MLVEGLVAIGLLIIVFQFVFSLNQVRYYNNFMKDIVNRYLGTQGYNLKTEIQKGILRSVIAVVVYTDDKEIVEAYYFDGVSVLSRFKEAGSLIGRQLDERLLDNSEIKEESQVGKAFKKIVVELK